MQKVLILSPHLDDAVLNCCDHILDWKNEKMKIAVSTIFTRFKSKSSNNLIKKRLSESGFSSLEKLEKQRKKEDRKAMEKLGVTWQHSDFVDCGFRIHENTPVYPSQKTLFSGIISPLDSHLMVDLEENLARFNKLNKILVPFGIGGNVDHVIVRKTAEKLFSPEKILYYIDYPYALKLTNWLLSSLTKLIFMKKSVKLMSERKRKILKIYSSQIPLLFKSRLPNYPEIILRG